MPAPLTFTLPSQQYAAGPTDLPPSSPYPTVPSGYSQAQIVINILQADYENVANHAAMTIFWRPDAAHPWQLAGGTTFNGGARVNPRNGQPDPPPTMIVGLFAAVVGWQVKFTWDSNNPMTWGATLTLR